MPDEFIFIIIAVIVITTILTSVLKPKNLRARKAAEASIGKPPEPSRINEPDSIAEYLVFVSQTNLSVDDITWSDLDMDDIFDRINTCASSVGEEYLYALLHRRPDETEGNSIKDIISAMEGNPSLRLKVCTSLHNLGICNYNGIAHKCFREQPFEALPYEKFIPFVPLLPFAAAAVFLPFKAYFAALLAFFAVMFFVIWVYFRLTKKLEGHTGTIRYLCCMLGCARKISGMSDSKDFAELAALSAHFDKAARRISRIGKPSSTDPLEEMFDAYIKMAAYTEIRAYIFMRRLIIKKQDVLRHIYDLVGSFDTACAVLNFRETTTCFCSPEFHDESRIHAEKLVHPLIAHPVANDFDMQGNILITGSNASGKSSFVKAMAVNAILAQTIFTCTAEKFALRRCHVVTSMAVRDDINQGDSYFVAEIKSMKRLVTAAEQEFCLCAVDEILKGTNTIERISASVSILEHMSKLESLCIAATHDIELTKILADSYRNVHFSERIEEDEVRFDYTVKEGAASTRNAIRLLEINGFDKEIIQRANSFARELEKEKPM